MLSGKELIVPHWYFGFQCRNSACYRWIAVFEVHAQPPFSVAQGSGRILLECPTCHTDGVYPLVEGQVLQAELAVKPSAGRQRED